MRAPTRTAGYAVRGSVDLVSSQTVTAAPAFDALCLRSRGTGGAPTHVGGSSPHGALIEHDLRWYTRGTQEVRNEPFAANAAKRKIPVFRVLVALAVHIQRRLRGTLKAVARVLIPSGLYP